MRKKILSLILALTMMLTAGVTALAADNSSSASQAYVEAMGQGWNLGNSFDGVDTDLSKEDMGEEAWGNPVVTRELLQAVKAKGYDSIRMPLTLYHRYTEADGKTVIDTEWLARYKEVVDWAVEEGLYVMINIHHDSWIWLSSWDGNEESAEYVRFVQLWEQLAECFKDEPVQVCFETINEPQFNEGSDEEKQEKLDALNLAAYHVIRSSGGNNGTRMIVMPTMNTNHEKCDPLLELIQGLDDENIIATVHYYSEWVYSANLGKTGFDEVLWDEYTPRNAADSAMSTVYEKFTKNGIGVVIGEYGLLGYDKSDNCNQQGEELKYYEYMNELARKYGICLMFWDNGSGIDRRSGNYNWKKPLTGAMLEASMEGRSSYATDLDTLYFSQEVTENVALPLTLNGNTFQGIEGLTEGVEYTYDAEKSVVTLTADYINQCYTAKDSYGTMAELTFHFSAGVDWKETLVKFAAPEFGTASGTAADGLTIPVAFNGAVVRRVTAYAGEDRTGPNSSWWQYLEHSSAYRVDDSAGTLTMSSGFFAECAEGTIKLVIEFYDGQTVEVEIAKNGDQVSTANTATASVFSDVADSAWYQEAVSYVASKGIMNGVSTTKFDPNNNLSRAQMCQIIYNMAGKPDTSDTPAYGDISATAWYADSVIWCCENGIAAGRSETDFAPDAAITREEVASFLYHYYTDYQGKEAQTGDISSFTDSGKINPDMAEAMSWAVGKELMKGNPNGTLVPDGTATRAEIATMMMRFCKTA